MSLFKLESKIPSTLLRDKFLVPPFSCLDAKSGYWMHRKQQWESIIGDRADNIRNTTAKSNTPYINQFDTDDFRGAKSPGAGDISTFDPFLAEILIKWFSRKGDWILDPFAGGVVRGAVANILERNYYGVDICTEQVVHNNKRIAEIQQRYNLTAKSVYINNDSLDELSPLKAPTDTEFDMLLMCPPYYNLEQYTNNPHDLSNMPTYQAFINNFRLLVAYTVLWMKDNTFACVVVEEIRDPDGIMYGFVADTIKAFTDAGYKYYNEMILENRVVSLGIRCPKYFNQSRKVGRHHQNVLVFYKGDANPDVIHEKFKDFEL